MAKETKTKGAGQKASAKSSSSTTRADQSMNLSELDRDALMRLRKEVDAALQGYDKRRRDDALREMQAIAQKHGINLKELAQPNSARTVSAPKYRHPENPAQTWTGRGRQPAWFKEAVDAGTKPEELLVA